MSTAAYLKEQRMFGLKMDCSD